MNKDKLDLKGSETRDEFKYLHKNLLPTSFYGCDLDFVLVAKYPFRIVSFLDYKKLREPITFSEVIAYNCLIKLAPVFIVRSNDVKKGPFNIFRYLNGDPVPEPPVVNLEIERQCATWLDFNDWEVEIRRGLTNAKK